ncbi:MAG: NAD(P)-dependent oxidoreductase [Saprospiraceae bacterium]|jgi:nucleoside-diphosphate-sugar epimerase|nr:NAD(P)-dependent oxidoreductase [Saprospiraceae bacterium]MBL0026783.1 NAD(P)-dependent oxidoreductase [Saprospiraceae bacterium]
MKEKLLITGANGFIGRFIAIEAIESGLEVYATVRQNSDISSLKGMGVHVITIDYNNQTELTNLFRDGQFKYVIHNAGLTKSPSSEEFLKINKGLMVSIMDAISASGHRIIKFTYVSSFASYGPADFQSNGIVTDTSKPHPVTKYGNSKLAAEQYIRNQKHIPYMIIRPTAVYGPGEKDLLNVFQLVNKHLDIQPALSGQKLTFIYVKDLARLILKATLSMHTNRAYFATDGHVYTGSALNGFIKEILGKRTLSIKIPVPIMKGMAFVTEKAAGLWNSYPIFNLDKVNEFKAKSWNCDVSNLEPDLGFTAEYDLPKGLAETISWYKANKWL